MEAGALPRPGRVLVPRSRRLLGALSDDRLVEQVRIGNDAAFEVLYDRHGRGILSFCRHMLGTLEEAEDAVQHTFIAAYNDLLTTDRPIKLKAWLYTIARNRCLSVLRARREHAVEEIEVSTTGLAEQVQERQDVRDLLADMRQLPDEQRAALVLSELGDLSHADIGDVLGVEAVKVKSLVFQARSTLIESREARAIPCQDIREQLATARGGALRRGPLRKHVKACEGCRQYRDEVRRQRAMMAAVLPVIPTLGLKSNALAAIGGGAGGGAAAAAGTTAGGVLSGLSSAGIATKAAVVLAVGAGAVGGGVALEHTVIGASSPPTNPPSSVEQGTTHRSSVADDHAQGPPGSVPGVNAVTTHDPRGKARRVRAHGSPATKHQGNGHGVTGNTARGGTTGRGHDSTQRGHSTDARGSQGTHRSTTHRNGTATGGTDHSAPDTRTGTRRTPDTTSGGDTTSGTGATPTTPTLPDVPLPDTAPRSQIHVPAPTVP